MRASLRVAKSGQVAIPPQIRDSMGIEPGDVVEIDVIAIVHKAKDAKDSKKP